MLPPENLAPLCAFPCLPVPAIQLAVQGQYSPPSQVRVADHPLIRVKLSILRAADTPSHQFRAALRDIASFLFHEATRDLAVDRIEVQTPLAACDGYRLARPIILIPILRAGTGLLDGILDVLPEASVGHIGLFRDELTHLPRHYYCKMPAHLPEAEVILLDPMLATGRSAAAAVSEVKKMGARHIRFLCLVSCPTGLTELHTQHPDVPIFTATIDPILNENAYIVPGLGDAGDRYFGTV